MEKTRFLLNTKDDNGYTTYIFSIDRNNSLNFFSNIKEYKLIKKNNLINYIESASLNKYNNNIAYNMDVILTNLNHILELDINVPYSERLKFIKDYISLFEVTKGPNIKTKDIEKNIDIEKTTVYSIFSFKSEINKELIKRLEQHSINVIPKNK